MLKRAVFSLLSLACLFAAGCGDDSEKTYGHWKSQDKTGVWYAVVEFAKDKMTLNGVSTDSAMETKDGKVVVRKAGTDSVLAIVTIVDDKTLDIEIDGKKTRYAKSTLEDNAKLLASSPRELAAGFWKTRNNMAGDDDVLEIGKDFIDEDGKGRTPMKLVEENGQLVLSLAGEKGMISPAVTFIDDDHIELASQWMGKHRYERITAEAAKAILSPAPETVFGFWKAGENILELTPEGKSLNGDAVRMTFASGRKEIIGSDPSDKGAPLVRIKIVGKDTIRVGETMSFGNAEYSRSTSDEAKAILAAHAALLDQAVGVWMSEKVEGYKRGGRDFMVVARDSFERNGEQRPGALRAVDGMVEAFNPEEPGRTHAKLKIVDNDTLETAGGMFSGSARFTRTTPEIMNLLFNPQPKDIEGHWLSDTGNAWLENDDALVFGASSMVVNGAETGIILESKNGKLEAKDGSSRQAIARISFLDGRTIEVDSGYNRGPKVYRRSDGEKTAKVVAAYKAGFERTKGYWLSDKEYPGRKGGREMVEIAEGKVTYNREKYSEYRPLFVNGRIYFTAEGTLNRHFGFIEIVDADTIKIESNAVDHGLYRRSSAEEVDELINPKPEKVVGVWLDEEKNVLGLPKNILILDTKGVMVNGKTFEAHYASGDGRIVVETPDRNTTILRIKRVLPGKIVVDGSANDNTYLSSSREAAQEVMAAYGKHFRNNVVGYWKAKRVGGKPEVLLIAPEQVVYNTSVRVKDYKLEIDRGNLKLVSGNSSVRIAFFEGNEIEFDFGGKYVRIDKAEYDELLKLWK